MTATPVAARARSRILLLTPRWPYPVIGGDRLRIWQLARHLAPRHDVTLLSLCQTAQEMSAPLPKDDVFAEAHRVLLPRWRSWLQMAAALSGPTPLQVAYYASAEFQRAVDALLPSHDLLCCHLARTAPYAQGARVPRWLEMTDAVSLTMARAASLPSRPVDPRPWLYRQEARRMAAYERRLAREFDLVTLVSSIDRQVVAANGGARTLVAPNGVDMPERVPTPAGTRAPNIALVGRMDSLANRDALWFFVRDVLPSVRQAVPAAQLHVIGHMAPADRVRLARQPGVRVVGTVDRLDEALGRCRVGVCPVRLGAGVQNKVLDYMAHGLACVSSPIGLEGLAVRAGAEAILAETPAQWVAQVTGLLHDNATCTALAERGHAWVTENSSWERALAGLLDRVGALAGSTPMPSRPAP